MAVPNPSPVSSSSSGSGVPSDPGVGHAPGTSLDPFSPLIETEVSDPTQTNAYQNILFMECYKRWSSEELRLADYNKGHHYGSSAMTPAATAFGSTRTSTGFNSFSPRASNPFATQAVSTFGSSIWSNPGTAQAPELSEWTRDTTGGLPSIASAGIFSAAATRGTNSSVRSDISEGSQKSKESAGIFSSAAATRGTNSSIRSDISGESQKSKESETELEWLKNRYFGTTSIAVKCGSDDSTYLFPHEALMRNFQYFRSLLKNEESTEKHKQAEAILNVHLEGLTTAAFARVVRWTQTEPRNREDPGNPRRDHTIDGLLDEIIAAYHLGLDDLLTFRRHISCLIATILLHDRRQMASKHIKLVGSHEAFGKQSRVMKVFVRAGTRPFLQLTMLSQAPMWQVSANPGHGSVDEWLAIIRHCRQLWAENRQYQLGVVNCVSRMLETCSRTVSGAALFHDPLDDDEMKGQRNLDFNVAFGI